MNEKMLEIFAEKLATEVRDRSIRICDAYNERRMSPTLRNPIEEAKKHDSHDEIVKAIIPFVVDKVIGRLLIAIEYGNLPLTFSDEEGKTLNLTAEYPSELSGWWACDQDGWIGRFSKERCVD